MVCAGRLGIAGGNQLDERAVGLDGLFLGSFRAGPVGDEMRALREITMQKTGTGQRCIPG